MKESKVFFDPTGKRARIVLRWLAAIAGFVALVISLFFFDLLSERPMNAAGVAADFHRMAPKTDSMPPLVIGEDLPSTPPPAGLLAQSGPLTVGFYSNWDDNSLIGLRRRVDRLDWLVPDWLTLQGGNMQLVVEIDPNVPKLLHTKARSPFVIPLLTNQSDEGPELAGLSRLLNDPALRKARIDQIIATLLRNHFQGVAVQFEGVAAADAELYHLFLNELKKALHAKGLLLVTVLTADETGLDPMAPGLAAVADHSILLDLCCTDPTLPIPLDGPDRAARLVRQALLDMPASKLILAVSNHGRHRITRPNQTTTLTDLGFADAMLLAHDHNRLPENDALTQVPHFAFRENTIGVGTDATHEVWFLDAITAQNTLARVQDAGLGGYALWRLGAEDPSVWDVLPKAGQLPTTVPEALSTIAMADTVFLTGTGDMLRVTTAPQDGARVIEVEGDHIISARYQTLPRPTTIDRYGTTKPMLALTFDDGPDERWTPAILDILAQENVKATFFVIGSNAAFAPALINRIIDEGHELGNHSFTHPNLSSVPDWVTTLELNATQRLIEVTSGRALRLFRAPYVGDSEPATLSEVRPMLLAQERGLAIVGLRADSHDWKHVNPNAIRAAVLREVGTADDPKSQTVLLHDAGGDRQATVAALPGVIRALKARGFTLVPVSALIDQTPAQVMPEVPKWTFSRLVASVLFSGLHLGALVLQWLFVLAIGLGIFRLALISVLGVLHSRREARIPPPPTTAEGVAVLIPAYNEEKVIRACLDRVTASAHPALRVIVIDDGSTDGTAEAVAQAAALDDRIHLLRIANGGKANALNAGLSQCHEDIIVALDADTQFHPDTVSRLARWFVDPGIVAVAGNARVGNRSNFLTRCQALEYITAQNLERRAYAALGCVTVVPGAVGAWRRRAVLAAGGFPDATLAEDQDLTIALQLQGGRVLYDSTAVAETEAPDTLRGLSRQRFRWSFGTMQCLWRYRHHILRGKRTMIGWFALPQTLLFQVVFSLVAPVIDLMLILRLLGCLWDYLQHDGVVDSEALVKTLVFYAVFLLAEIVSGFVAFRLDRRENLSLLALTVPQRFGYRQFLSLIAMRATITAVLGRLVGWGHLERKATVTLAEPSIGPAE